VLKRVKEVYGKIYEEGNEEVREMLASMNRVMEIFILL